MIVVLGKALNANRRARLTRESAVNSLRLLAIFVLDSGVDSRYGPRLEVLQ